LEFTPKEDSEEPVTAQMTLPRFSLYAFMQIDSSASNVQTTEKKFCTVQNLLSKEFQLLTVLTVNITSRGSINSKRYDSK